MVHGSCPNCGGFVTTPDYWYGVLPPTPTCVSCGRIIPFNKLNAASNTEYLRKIVKINEEVE